MRGYTILFVDNNAECLELCKMGLELCPLLKVHTENNPRMAASKARKLKPDLILLDLVMPTMHGSDVAAKIREISALKDTPIVYITGKLAKKIDVRKYHQERNKEYLVRKPINADDLAACLLQILENRRSVAFAA